MIKTINYETILNKFYELEKNNENGYIYRTNNAGIYISFRTNAIELEYFNEMDSSIIDSIGIFKNNRPEMIQRIIDFIDDWFVAKESEVIFDTECEELLQRELYMWRTRAYKCNDDSLNIKRQKEGYLGNILEELSELQRAITSNNKEEIIDALCDCLVIRFNGIENIKSLPRIQNLKPTTTLVKLLVSHIELNEANNSTFVNYCLSALDYISNGNAYGCLEETLKEISSRILEWDDSIKKLVKKPNPNQYKADYSKYL